MANSVDIAQPILLCPLQFERSALVAAGLEDSCDIVCCGPGEAAGIWVKDNSKHIASQPLILAGLAGGLRSDILVKTAHIAERVIDEKGNSWTPSFDKSIEASKKIVVSTSHAVVTPQAKKTLADRCKADIVDLESVGFAEAAISCGCKWTVVRGISDCVDDSLPVDIDKWVDSNGSTRPSAVVGSILKRPAVLGDIRRMRSASIGAMKAVSVIIKSIIGK